MTDIIERSLMALDALHRCIRITSPLSFMPGNRKNRREGYERFGRESLVLLPEAIKEIEELRGALDLANQILAFDQSTIKAAEAAALRKAAEVVTTGSVIVIGTAYQPSRHNLAANILALISDDDQSILDAHVKAKVDEAMKAAEAKKP